MSNAGAPKPPKCRDCGKRTNRVFGERNRFHNQLGQEIVEVRHVWLCADCEYLRSKPDAPRFVKPPRERSKRLQKETLLDVLAERVV